MIEKNPDFNELGGAGALWCGADMDATDLARVAEFVVTQNVGIISVSPDAVATVWPWLENVPVKIYSRFYLPNKKITERQVSDITVRINSVLKRGAYGAQVFLLCEALGGLVEQTHIIRDDLFFNKALSIGLDIMQIDAYDWVGLFENLRKINATSVLFVMTNETGDKSDFVGRIYGMLENWNPENKFDLHFMLGADFMRIEQVQRLVKLLRPELEKRLKFFVS